MKRWILLLLLCGFLTGCTAAPAGPAPAEPAPEAPCSLTLEMTEWEDTALDEDGTLLARCRASVPKLTARRSDGTAIETAETEDEKRVLAAAETFNGEFAGWTQREPLEELAEIAREERAWRREAEIEWTMEFFVELNCQVYEKDRLVSVDADSYTYTGGAHPNTVLMAWNFDLETGAFFTPEQLAEDGALFSQAVAGEIIRQLPAAAEALGLTAEELFWSDREEIIARWSSYAVSFDEAGMTVAFSPYELAAYAAGPQVFQIPYDFLAPYLSDYGRAVLGLAED